MKRIHLVTGSLAAAGIATLILDGKTALAGAQEGLELCLRTVVPSLFPFLLLSGLLIGSIKNGAMPFLKPLEALCGIPEGSGTILLCGLLGGYPTGAQCLSSAHASGVLSQEDADRMLGFCNNAGPAFLFGMIGPMFQEPATAALLWLIHLESALLTAMVLPGRSRRNVSIPSDRSPDISASMHSALSVMAVICGWVIFFRILIAFLDRWFFWFLPNTVQIVITGLLELSNGCCCLGGISDPGVRLIVCSCLLSAGGLCVTMQTRSAAPDLSIRAYGKGKIYQTVFSFLLSISMVTGCWAAVSGLMILVGLLIQNMQKRSSNPALIGV